eukprot:4243531-Pyramimonas_sp.AAC.1
MAQPTGGKRGFILGRRRRIAWCSRWETGLCSAAEGAAYDATDWRRFYIRPPMCQEKNDEHEEEEEKRGRGPRRGRRGGAEAGGRRERRRG